MRRIAGTLPFPNTEKVEEEAKRREERETAKRIAKAVQRDVERALVPQRKKRKPESPGVQANRDIEAIEAAERADRALFLRRNGASYAEIARELRVTPTTAGSLVRAAIAALPRENAEEHRARLLLTLEARQLEAQQMIADLKQRIRSLPPNEHRSAVACHNAIRGYHDTLTRLGEAHARLTGAHAPIRHELSMTPPNAAAIRDMSDEDVQKIASGDFTPIARAGRVAVDGASAAGDGASPDESGGRAGADTTH